MSAELNIFYRPSVTGARFHASDAFVRGIRGPIGSGKSVACVLEIFKRASAQRKGPDGIRRSRWAAIRNTYPELRTTTIKTWQDWFPESICKFNYGSPITCVLKLGDIELEVIFLALDKPKDVKKLKSLELTGVWGNEASELPKSVIDMATGRVGRYPSKKDGGFNWTGVILDTNPPDDSHWWYALAETQRPKGWEFFAQPPALIRVSAGVYIPNPSAENIGNHETGYDYYLNQIGGKTEEWIKVFVLGQYGSVLDGRPVYAEYNDARHCAEDIIEPMRGLPLLLGWDYGRTPAVIICQITPRGQFRVIDEAVVDAAGNGMGLRTFTRDVVRPLLREKYDGMAIKSVGDPAGIAKDGNDLDCFDIQAAEGIPTHAAKTNNPVSRQDSVIRLLTSMSDGEPGFLLSPNCTMIRRGFLGGYRFKRMQVSGEERYTDAPEKNRFSHPHDALQYAAMESQDVRIVVSTAAKPVVIKSAQGWT